MTSSWPQKHVDYLRAQWGRDSPNAIGMALGRTTPSVLAKAATMDLAMRKPVAKPRRCLCGCGEMFTSRLHPSINRIKPEHAERLR